jgi:hypothetical protein
MSNSEIQKIGEHRSNTDEAMADSLGDGHNYLRRSKGAMINLFGAFCPNSDAIRIHAASGSRSLSLISIITFCFLPL